MPDTVLPTRRGLRLAYGVLLMLCVGCLYAWSIFAAAINAELAWDGATGWVFTLSIICFCLGGLLGSRLSGRLGVRGALLAAALLLLAGFALASRAGAPWQLMLSYGVGAGLGFGISYNAVVTAVNACFPDKTGFSAGFLMLGMGFGSLVFGTVISRFISTAGWRAAFLYTGIIIAPLIAAGAFVIRKPSACASPSGALDASDVPPREMLRRRSFRLYFVWCTLLPISGLLVIGNAVPISLELGASAQMGVLCTGIISVASGAGRVFWGMFYDARGWRASMTLLSFAGIAAPVLLLSAFLFASLPLLTAAFVLIGICYGGCPTINTTFLQEFYGRRYFSDNLAILNISLLTASLCSSPLASCVYSATGSYGGAAYVMLGLNIAAFFIMRLMSVKSDNIPG